MAYGDVIQTASNTSGGGGSSTASVTFTAPTVDNLVVIAVCTDDGADATPGTGYVSQVHADNTVVGTEIFTKISDGTETSISWSLDVSQEWVVLMLEIEGPHENGTADVTATNYESNASDAAGSTGTTATTSQADEIAVAVCTAQDGDAGDNNPIFSNSFVHRVDRRAGSNIGDVFAVAATKLLTATGTQETEADWQGPAATASRSHNAIATFKKGSGGGGAAPDFDYGARRNAMTGNMHR